MASSSLVLPDLVKIVRASAHVTGQMDHVGLAGTYTEVSSFIRGSSFHVCQHIADRTHMACPRADHVIGCKSVLSPAFLNALYSEIPVADSFRDDSDSLLHRQFQIWAADPRVQFLAMRIHTEDCGHMTIRRIHDAERYHIPKTSLPAWQMGRLKTQIGVSSPKSPA